MEFNELWSRSAMVFAAALLVFWASGCGIGEQRSISQFSGTWSEEAGSTFELTCNGETWTDDSTSNITLSEGTNSDLIYADDECTLEFDVDGDRATIVPGQTCEISVDDGKATTDFGSYTIEKSGETFEYDARGDVLYEFDNGSEADCNFRSEGTATKVSD